MGYFSSLKSSNPFRHSRASSNNSDTMNDGPAPPPADPPPAYQQSDPRTTNSHNDYAPPPGPPPGHSQEATRPASATATATAPAPPPAHHDWQSVALPEEATAAYPPPPALFAAHDRSWAANATAQQAAEGERWCRRYPLLAPRAAPPAAPPAGPPAPPTLVAPQTPAFRGTIAPSLSSLPGRWTVRTAAGSGDCTITAQPPLYAAARDRPRCAPPARARAPAPTAYFEVRVLRDLDRAGRAGAGAGVGIGFVALPYPAFRMPGWHRGALAVHSDDGRRYANDRWGGVDCVAPWGRGGTVVGLGLAFSASPPASPAAAAAAARGIEVEAFFTRNGAVEARWDVNEERDGQRALGPVGVQGFHDLVAAVGCFGETEFEVVLDPDSWLYKPAQLWGQ